VSLQDFKGKPVLLNFWTTYCQGCLTEMDLLKPIYDKFKDKIFFVSISADNQFEKMVYFVSMKKDFTWIFLHIGDQMQLLKDYDVRTYPLFVLIDEQGKIVKYPADLPGNGLEATLDKMVSK
jgi:thiol-disulfide isomerase/thioredoxin